jgi:hypothetical protein
VAKPQRGDDTAFVGLSKLTTSIGPSKAASQPPHSKTLREARSANVLSALLFLLLVIPATAATYTTQTFDNGGHTRTSASYSLESSTGGIIGLSASPTHTLKHGFAGQLTEAQSLLISADPEAITEDTTSQLSGTATMTDGSTTHLSGSEVQWSVVSGPISAITSSGLATADQVIINAPATVRGRWDGISGEVIITVLNSVTQRVATPGTSAPPFAFFPISFDWTKAFLYQGLLRDNADVVVGTITGLNLTVKGSFTSKVIFNGITYALAGKVQQDGSYSGEIKRTGKTPISVTLNLGSTDVGTFMFQGTVTGDGVTAGGPISMTPYTSKFKAPTALVKSYTFLMPATSTVATNLPEGYGYGTATVSTLGVIKATGKTGDGVAFTTSGFLTIENQWHLFQLLYASKGQMAGTLTFRDLPDISDLDGTLNWAKNPDPKAKSYPLGFSQTPVLVGSLYTPPLKGQRALAELADQHFNAHLSLTGEVLPGGGLGKTLSWLNTNALTYFGPEKLTATTTATTGIMAGSYSDPITKLTVPFTGAAFQKQGLAAGNFLYNNKSGYLFIKPGTHFTYSGSESAGPLLRLTLPSTQADQPSLTPATFIAAAAGSFGGILLNGTDISGGLETVVISKTGALSGTVVLGGKRYAFKGVIAANGTAPIIIKRTGLTDITGSITLALADGTTDGFQLTGTFTSDGTTHAIDAQRYPVYTTAAPAPETGKYTLAMPSPAGSNVSTEPGGDAYASLIVTNTGKITGTLVLPEGTTATFAGQVSRKAEWSLHRSLYGTTGGYLVGKITFRDLPGLSDLDGQWRWTKPNTLPKSLTYPGGFNVTRQVIGSRFTTPPTNQRTFLNLANTNDNTWFRLTGPDLSPLTTATLTSVDRVVTWTTADKLLYYGPDKATLTFTRTTGLLTGTYADAAIKVSVKIGGILLQKQNRISGSYIASGQSGLMIMTPR